MGPTLCVHVRQIGRAHLPFFDAEAAEADQAAYAGGILAAAGWGFMLGWGPSS